MFEILEESTESCIGFKASGKAIAADYEMLLPRLDEAIKAHSKIDMVVVLSDFDGWGELDAIHEWVDELRSEPVNSGA